MNLDDIEVPERWGEEHAFPALREGWTIFSVDAADHAPLELCKVDDPGAVQDDIPEAGVEYDEPVFNSDPEAWEFVLAKAEEGSKLHLTALAFLRKHSPTEYEAIMTHHEDRKHG